MPGPGRQPVHAVFIRAPVIEPHRARRGRPRALDDGRIVAVRERNVIATAFHPELAGETRFHRLVATMAAEHDDPGEGAGRRPHPTRREERQASPPMSAPLRQGPRRAPDRSRGARRAVAAVPERRRRRRARSACPSAARRSGCSACSGCRSGAFRPHDLLYVYEDEGRLAGLLRVERESRRDEWTIVELDGVGRSDAGDIRFRLVQHLLRDGAQARRVAVPRRVRRRGRQRRAVHAGRVRPLRRGDRAVRPASSRCPRR